MPIAIDGWPHLSTQTFRLLCTDQGGEVQIILLPSSCLNLKLILDGDRTVLEAKPPSLRRRCITGKVMEFSPAHCGSFTNSAIVANRAACLNSSRRTRAHRSHLSDKKTYFRNLNSF